MPIFKSKKTLMIAVAVIATVMLLVGIVGIRAARRAQLPGVAYS